MRESNESMELLRAWRGTIPVQNLYTAGKAGEVFFRALRDRGVILGSPCGGCGIVYVPARSFCERCFGALETTRPVGPGGRVEAVSEVHLNSDGKPLPRPMVLVAVRLDGAGTLLIHRIAVPSSARRRGGVPVRVGSRVRAVLEPRSRRRGSILDIRHFVPSRSRR